MNSDSIKNRLHDALHRGHQKATDEDLAVTEILVVAMTEVVAEIAILPLAFGAIGIATVFSAANLALLARRVMIEERALAPRRPVGAQSP